ncbi:hypothetical protein [Streptomyces sp. NBC_00724]|uniref:hypothetical protein n=1 Tax=Streptomyces sp. NBC_00724 TaxID=2975812 RepID=UPI002ED3F3C2|nr:hypothetical protein OHB17_38325 [Streptomyces sp. NBC_00724]
MTMLAEQVDGVIGVDTHRDTLAAAAVSPIGAVVSSTDAPANARGYRRRSGDRQLNRALHTISLIRMRLDPTTKAYVARRVAEGKTSRDAQRCLKRTICRQLFKILEHSDRETGTNSENLVQAA